MKCKLINGIRNRLMWPVYYAQAIFMLVMLSRHNHRNNDDGN